MTSHPPNEALLILLVCVCGFISLLQQLALFGIKVFLHPLHLDLQLSQEVLLLLPPPAGFPDGGGEAV